MIRPLPSRRLTLQRQLKKVKGAVAVEDRIGDLFAGDLNMHAACPPDVESEAITSWNDANGRSDTLIPDNLSSRAMEGSEVQTPDAVVVSKISLDRIDAEIRKQGQDLQEMLRMFKDSTSAPLSSCILQTPQNKIPSTKDPALQIDAEQELQQRKSPRLKNKNNSGKTIVKLAQDLIAKKRGITTENESLESMTL
jgi:hypothetical protein